MRFAPITDPAAILDARDAGLGLSATTRAVLLAGLCGVADDADLLDLPIGARDARLLELRRAWFGERIDGLCECDACGESIEIAFDAGQITTASAPAGASVEVTTADRSWRARVPTSRDLLALERTSPHDARSRLLRRLLDDQDEPDAATADIIVAALAARDPQADVLLDLACPTCDRRVALPFDIANFLWDELDRWAHGLLDEIHVLARAYGWREHDILAMPASRRAAYIERAGSHSGLTS